MATGGWQQRTAHPVEDGCIARLLHSQGAKVKGEAPAAVGVWERLDSIGQATEESGGAGC